MINLFKIQSQIDSFYGNMIQSGSLRVLLISANALKINHFWAFFHLSHILILLSSIKKMVTHLVTHHFLYFLPPSIQNIILIQSNSGALKDKNSVHPIGFEPMLFFRIKYLKH